MTWDTVEELKELLQIVNEALDKQEAEDKYFEMLRRTNSLQREIIHAAMELNEPIVIHNLKNHETMTVTPGDLVLIHTQFMLDWETKD